MVIIEPEIIFHKKQRTVCSCFLVSRDTDSNNLRGERMAEFRLAGVNKIVMQNHNMGSGMKLLRFIVVSSASHQARNDSASPRFQQKAKRNKYNMQFIMHFITCKIDFFPPWAFPLYQ